MLRYGATIRKRSRYAQEAAALVTKMSSESELELEAEIGASSRVRRIRVSSRARSEKEREEQEQARREVHTSVSLVSMRTTKTGVSESVTLVDGGSREQINPGRMGMDV